MDDLRVCSEGACSIPAGGEYFVTVCAGAERTIAQTLGTFACFAVSLSCDAGTVASYVFLDIFVDIVDSARRTEVIIG